MMSTVGDTGVMSTGRVSAAGQLKVIQKIAIQSIENRRSVRSGARKPIREATKEDLGMPDCAGSGIHA